MSPRGARTHTRTWRAFRCAGYTPARRAAAGARGGGAARVGVDHDGVRRVGDALAAESDVEAVGAAQVREQGDLDSAVGEHARRCGRARREGGASGTQGARRALRTPKLCYGRPPRTNGAVVCRHGTVRVACARAWMCARAGWGLTAAGARGSIDASCDGGGGVVGGEGVAVGVVRRDEEGGGLVGEPHLVGGRHERRHSEAAAHSGVE
eukprot:3134427-Prymnesium_polylepis.1